MQFIESIARFEWCACISDSVYGTTCMTVLNMLLDYKENISFSFCDDCLLNTRGKKRTRNVYMKS